MVLLKEVIRQGDPFLTKASQRLCAQKVLEMCCKDKQNTDTYLDQAWFKAKHMMGLAEMSEGFQGGAVSYLLHGKKFIPGNKLDVSTNIYGFCRASVPEFACKQKYMFWRYQSPPC